MRLTKISAKIDHPKIILVLLPLIVLLEIGRTFYQTDALYILSRILLLYFLIFAYSEAIKNKQLKVYIILVLLFALWALATTIWSYDPIITFPRAFYFAYVAIATAIGGYLWYSNFSKSILGFLLPANIAIVVVSLFSLVTSKPADAWTGGCGIGFMGFAPHQNILGMIILLTIPAVLFPVFSFLSRRNPEKPDTSLRSNSNTDISPLASHLWPLTSPVSRLTFHTLLLLLNLYLLILTHSRASIISALLMVVTYLLFSFNWRIVITAVLTLVLFITAIFFASPQIKTAVTDYMFKTEKRIGDRRSSQLDATLSAAKHGGIIGLGYGISDPLNINPKDVIEGTRYYREKMISVLALVEEVGVIGLSLFLIIIWNVFWGLVSVVKIKNSKLKFQNFRSEKETAFIIAVIVGLSFHAQIEGWWLGAGSWQFMLFFLFIGLAFGVINKPSLKSKKVCS